MWNSNHETRRLMPKKILRSISEDVRDAILSKIPNNWLVYIHITNCINGKKHWFNFNIFIEIDLLLTIILGCVFMMIL